MRHLMLKINIYPERTEHNAKIVLEVKSFYWDE